MYYSRPGNNHAADSWNKQHADDKADNLAAVGAKNVSGGYKCYIGFTGHFAGWGGV